MMNLGYACINVELAEQGITTNRGMIRKTSLEKGDPVCFGAGAAERPGPA